jgi:hypothetical protein
MQGRTVEIRNKLVYRGITEGKVRYLAPVFACIKVVANIICQKLRCFLHLNAPNWTETTDGSIIKLEREKAAFFVALLNHFLKNLYVFFKW